MLLYRIYWIGADGHIRDAENLDCASDQDAIAEAWKRIGDYPAIELWLGTRRVAQLGEVTQAASGSASSDSRARMLTRSAAAVAHEHRRLMAEQAEAREAMRRTREKSEQLRLTERKSSISQTE